MTLALAVRAAVFKRCCLQEAAYDGAQRNYFFPRLIFSAISKRHATLK
jgi:hypothetical protein